MDFDKCLIYYFFFILFSMSPKLVVSTEPKPTEAAIVTTQLSTPQPTPLSRPSKGCQKVYSTEITVHKGLQITLHCPSCTQELKDVRYQWEILVPCNKESEVCWQPINQTESKWTFTVDANYTAHCNVFGLNGAQKINQSSGNINLRIEDNVSEYEYCEVLVSSGRVTVLVAVITSVVILIITLSIGLYFLCKKRLASVAPVSGRGGGGHCLHTHQRGSDPYAEEFTEDGYLRPNGVGLIREQSYLEILSDHDMRRSNVSSCTSENGQPQSLNYYENIESVRNRQ